MYLGDTATTSTELPLSLSVNSEPAVEDPVGLQSQGGSLGELPKRTMRRKQPCDRF
jgi:hypothetical protein